MKYQRVLYTSEFSIELKTKLRIESYDKRRSLKGNVYYVGFASDADMTYADRLCKRLRNVTMKPFQSRSADKTQYQRQSKQLVREKTDKSSTTMTTSVTGTNCGTVICSSKKSDNQDGEVVSNIQTTNFNTQQLLDDVQSCLNAIKATQRAAADVYQVFKNGMNCEGIVERLLQTHSTAFYLKAATSIKIKDILSAGIKLSWPNIANDINEFRLAIGYEQSFMMKMASAQHILSKINNQSSMTLSSKLAYQLVKLSH